MERYAGQTADTGDSGALGTAARDGRAAAMSRRRALASGRSALPPAHERVRTGPRQGKLRAPAAAVDATPSAASNGQGGPSTAQRAPAGSASATDGRAVAKQRRRQLSRGKKALNGSGDRRAGAARAPVFVVHRGGGR